MFRTRIIMWTIANMIRITTLSLIDSPIIRVGVSRRYPYCVRISMCLSISHSLIIRATHSLSVV